MEAGAGGQPEAEALQYDTPQQLLDMAEHDRGGYLRGILQVLENAGEYLAAGRLPPSELKLPMQLAPYPTSIIRIKGYEGGEYSPGELGVGCTVVPPSEGRGSNTTGGWSLRSVSSLNPSPPPACPPASLSSWVPTPLPTAGLLARSFLWSVPDFAPSLAGRHQARDFAAWALPRANEGEGEHDRQRSRP